MQRRIVAFAVVGVMLAAVALGGAWFAYRQYKQNRPHSMWVPLVIRADLEIAKRDEVVQSIRAGLTRDEVLTRISRDLSLTGKWELPDEQACKKELAARMFIRPGDADTPMGKVPAILIGVKGKVKDTQLSGKIAERMMEEVWPIIGVDPPPPKDDR